MLGKLASMPICKAEHRRFEAARGLLCILSPPGIILRIIGSNVQAVQKSGGDHQEFGKSARNFGLFHVQKKVVIFAENFIANKEAWPQFEKKKCVWIQVS